MLFVTNKTTRGSNMSKIYDFAEMIDVTVVNDEMEMAILDHISGEYIPFAESSDMLEFFRKLLSARKPDIIARNEKMRREREKEEAKYLAMISGYLPKQQKEEQ